MARSAPDSIRNPNSASLRGDFFRATLLIRILKMNVVNIFYFWIKIKIISGQMKGGFAKGCWQETDAKSWGPGEIAHIG